MCHIPLISVSLSIFLDELMLILLRGDRAACCVKGAVVRRDRAAYFVKGDRELTF